MDNKQPTAEHKKLNALVGTWTVKGKEDVYIEKCEMFQGGYFLVCNSESKTKDGQIKKGVSIFGYSEVNKYHTYYHYGSAGISNTLKGNIDNEGTLLFEGEEMYNGELVKVRVTMKRNGKNYDFKEEVLTDGKEWTTSADIEYIRLK